MALVYEARNRVNGKRYIGITRTSLEQRVYAHIWNATATTKAAKPWGVFSKAIRKYGKHAFEFRVLEEGLTFEQALVRERGLIAQQKPEYNVSAGGYGPNGLKWTEERRIRTAKSLSAAWTPERRARHSETMKQKPPLTAEQRKERANKQRIARAKSKAGYRPVVCLTDGRWFEAIKFACAAYNVTHSDIHRSATGREVSAKGLMFLYATTPLSERDCHVEIARRHARLDRRHDKAIAARSRPVVCITDGKHYSSGTAAARAYDLSQMTIVQCCKGGARTMNGLRFRYEDEPARDKHNKTKAELAAIRARQNAGLKKAARLAQKRVICMDDGREFDSISDAAAAYGTTTALVSAAIYRKGRCGGRRFRFIEASRC